MELPSIEGQGYGVGITVEKQAQMRYNLRKRKRSPSEDQNENEKLPRSKIPRHVKCLPILPPESKITEFNNLVNYI